MVRFHCHTLDYKFLKFPWHVPNDNEYSQATLAPNYPSIPENVSTESSSEEDEDSFDKTRRHFQQLRQISLGNEFKYKMEMEIKQSAKEENLRNSVPFVKQLSVDSHKAKPEFSINGDVKPYGPTTQKIFIWKQVNFYYITLRLTKTFPVINTNPILMYHCFVNRKSVSYTICEYFLLYRYIQR